MKTITKKMYVVVHHNLNDLYLSYILDKDVEIKMTTHLCESLPEAEEYAADIIKQLKQDYYCSLDSVVISPITITIEE